MKKSFSEKIIIAKKKTEKSQPLKKHKKKIVKTVCEKKSFSEKNHNSKKN